MIHTPGPWRLVSPGQAGNPRPAVVVGDRLRIIVDHAEDWGDPTPDARLVAAAPDMYKVLKKIVTLEWDGAADVINEAITILNTIEAYRD